MPDEAIPAPIPAAKGKPLLTAILVAVAAGVGGAGGGAAIVWSGAAALSPSAHKAEPPPKPVAPTLVELPRPFTANLRETGRYIQLSLGLAVTGGEAAADDLKHNDVAIRSAVLETLSSRSDSEIAEPDGKHRLRLALVKSLNEALKRSAADYRVTDVFFTAFVVQ